MFTLLVVEEQHQLRVLQLHQLSSAMERLNIRKAECLCQCLLLHSENRSTVGEVSIDSSDSSVLTHIQRLFVDTSSAFHPVILWKLILKLHNQGLTLPLCQWIQDVLTNRPQVVRMGGQHILHTGC